MGREPFRYDRFTVALWVFLGAIIMVTSVAAVLLVGAEGLYLVVTGWIVGPFVLYWLFKKLRNWIKRDLRTGVIPTQRRRTPPPSP